MSRRVIPAAFLGSWRIETMELWDRDAIDLLGPAAILFEDEAFGESHFIAVRGWMDCRFGCRDDKPLVDFSWQGRDEMDEALGRGWAVIQDDGTLAGSSGRCRAGPIIVRTSARIGPCDWPLDGERALSRRWRRRSLDHGNQGAP